MEIEKFVRERMQRKEERHEVGRRLEKVHEEYARRQEMSTTRKCVPVKCTMSEKNQTPLWELGDLQILPDQEKCPLIISDDILRDLQRNSLAIHVLMPGATAQLLVTGLKKVLEELKQWQTLKFWIIFMGGHHDLCGSNSKCRDVDSLAGCVTEPLKELITYCSSEDHFLTISNLIPNPCEQDPEFSKNPLVVRKVIADAQVNVNKFIQCWDSDSKLEPNRFFRHEQEFRRGKVRSRRSDTGHMKIRTGRYEADGLHPHAQFLHKLQTDIDTLIKCKL